MKATTRKILFTVMGVLLLTNNAQAYLDPGTGSMILQGVIAGIAMATVTIKLYWHRLVAFFKGEKLEKEEDLLAGLDTESDENVD